MKDDLNDEKKNEFLIADLTRNMNQFHPIHLPPPTPLLLRSDDKCTEEQIQKIRFHRRAQYWPCSNCAFLLGFCHLFCGVILLFFDIFTNYITQTPFAISASLFFIICAIFSFITIRRIDIASQILLLIFAFISLVICVIIFLESAIIVNELCDVIEKCYVLDTFLYSVLLCLSLIEGTICMTTLIVCFRSLNQAYLVPQPESPYKILLIGDYRSLKKEPPKIFKRKYDSLISSLLA